MISLFYMMENLISELFPGNLELSYDSSRDMETVYAKLCETTPDNALKIRNKILKSATGELCFNGGDIKLENGVEWEGTNKTYPIVIIEFYLVSEMLDYYEGKISCFNGKFREE